MPSEQKTEVKSQYRTRDSIARDTLEFIISRGGKCKRTDIFYGLRLTYEQIRFVEQWFTENKVVNVNGNEYTVLAKGRAYIAALQKADAILKGAVA